VAGVLYALIALGFVLIFKASGVFNFAQGIMVVFAALTLVGLYEKGVPAWLALILTIGVMLLLAVTVERVVLRRSSTSPTSSCSWRRSGSPSSSSASARRCSAATRR
jgi:branched-chain amino acid transport system permease protein